MNLILAIEAAPFEIDETGWGEFEASIKIFFVDANEKPVNAAYYLRLFKPVVTKPDGKQIVLYEHYDELVSSFIVDFNQFLFQVFVEPTLYISRALKENSGKVPIKSLTDCKLTSFKSQ